LAHDVFQNKTHSSNAQTSFLSQCGLNCGRFRLETTTSCISSSVGCCPTSSSNGIR